MPPSDITDCVCIRASQAIKNRVEPTLPPPKRRMRNMTEFVLRGTYHVTYPKKGAVKTESPCCAKHAKGHDDGPKRAGVDSGVDKSSPEYASAQRLLSSIDSKLQEAEEGRGAVPNGHLIPPQKQQTANPLGPEQAIIKPPAAGGASHGGHQHGISGARVHAHQEDDDDDDGYDSEFVDSALNDYQRHYFAEERASSGTDGEDEDGSVGGDEGDAESRSLLPAGGSRGGAHEHESDGSASEGEGESSRLLTGGGSSKRLRTDSVQLARDSKGFSAAGGRRESGMMRINSIDRM